MFPFWLLKLNQDTEVLKALFSVNLRCSFLVLVSIYFAWEKSGIT